MRLILLNTLKDFIKTKSLTIIKKQLIRSATSVASNYRAVCRARSDAEFFSKLCIVVEEADETLFWLELITEAEIYDESLTKSYIKEAEEILKIVSKSRKTLKEKTQNKNPLN